jgi:hypothetical protein
MAKQRSYSKRGDIKGHIICICKTPYANSPFEKSNIGTNKQLKKLRTAKKYTSKLYPHSYKVEKGSKLTIGTDINDCSCSLSSGKARTSQHRVNRKDPSYIRTRKLKNINSVNFRFT